MFVSQERGAARKPFQKPNILRRKPKAAKRKTESNNESSSLSSISNDFGVTSLPVVQTKELYSQPLQISQAPSLRLISISELCGDQGVASQTLYNNGGDNMTFYPHDAQVDGSDICAAQSTLNVESFLNNGSVTEGKFLLDIEDSSKTVETENKQKWCLDFGQESKNIVTTSYFDGSQISNNFCVDESLLGCTSTENKHLLESSLSEIIKVPEDVDVPVPSNLNTVTVNVDSVKITVKFECDVPNCKKTFWTEARLQKHKNDHNKPKTFPVLHCPVKHTDAEGVETHCQRTFQVRNQLMKHLNDEHSPEDALYKCGKCGRRFYWACGARMHQANGCSRTFKCGWAGCDRVFRQQCRLREHARAHTGDRPYPCHYSGCGWAFRSASKLMRHARRHTGERRHACGACGRAFPRAEHLREHIARNHAPVEQHLPCTHPGCEQTFSSTSSLHTHLKKVHKDEDMPPPPKKQKKPKKERFVLQLTTPTPQIETIEASVEGLTAETSEQISVEPTEAVECPSLNMKDGIEVAVDGDADGRCARTHCTWPLRREADYALEEHAQVEQSESCESNIYTVRSDLFLHGNLLINEDSEFIIGRAAAGGDAASAEGGEGALGLIDSHPTGDLTQEELLYADAVDESSFRVFLLNGEELA